MNIHFIDRMPEFLTHNLNRLKTGQYIFYTGVIDKLVNFLLVVLLAKKLDLNDFGNFIIVLSLINIFISLFNFGFGILIQREYASGNKSELIFYYIFYLKLILFPVYIASVFIYLLLFPVKEIILLFSLSAVFYIRELSDVFVKSMFGKNNFKSFFKSFCLSRFMFVSLLIIFYFFWESIICLILPFSIAALTEFFWLKVLTGFRYSKFFTIKYEWIETARIIKLALPFAVGVVSVTVYDRIDILIIKELISSEAVGLYSTAYSFYRLPLLLPPILLMPLFTELSKNYSGQKNLIFDKVKLTIKSLLILAVLSTLFFALFSDFIIDVTFGNKFMESAGILKILSLGLIFIILNNLTGVILNSIRREKLQLYGVLSGLSLNIVLNIILLPVLGIVGAAVSTVASELIVLIFHAGTLIRSAEIWE